MTEQIRRKLIEVALPLDAINAASAREKSIRHGHPSTLHLWWARRPLAACRAVLFAQLVDDPSSRPEEFPKEEDQDRERERLFRIIEDLVKWENLTNEAVLNAARAEILRSTDGTPPPILDPFAGGGSIPLEAQRLGLETIASDLNPVAVLINKALIEIPPKWADRGPVHPEAQRRIRWSGAEGLAEDIRLYGKSMRDEAERRIGHLYPKALLEDGSEANVIAWIWARTVMCPNPACGATLPLVNSHWLCRKASTRVWLSPIVTARSVSYVIERGSGTPVEGNVSRNGAQCFVCGTETPLSSIRRIASSRGMGNTLLAVVAEGQAGRVYLPADAVTDVVAPSGVRSESPLPESALGFRVQAYGLKHYEDLHSKRQLATLDELARIVKSDVVPEIVRSGACEGYARDLQVYLGLVLGRVANRTSTQCFWDAGGESIMQVFARNALPMIWVYAEGNPFSDSTGNVSGQIAYVANAVERLPASGVSTVVQGDARYVRPLKQVVISTDPPYYDNVGYAALSDFFYVWLRRALGDSDNPLFATVMTPKDGELISEPGRHISKDKASEFFERGLTDVWKSSLSNHDGAFPMTVFYAFKQAESSPDDGISSTGWSTMLEGLISEGWSVTATWPIRTEQAGGLRVIGRNALASSIVLACRPRPADVGLTDRQGFVRALGQHLPTALHELQKANIAPVDLRQAAIGPGMAVFSSYSRVVEPDGGPMSVRTALGLINQALDQVLGDQEAEFDSETRWAVQWFSQFFEAEGPYGTAEQLAVAVNISVDGMRRSGIVESGGGKVRLLGRDEYPDVWNPTDYHRTPVWEACQHLVRRLESEGEEAAGHLLAQLGGLGESAQLLAYRLFSVSERSRPGLAGPYNSLVASWPQIQHHARVSRVPGTPDRRPEQQRLGD